MLVVAGLLFALGVAQTAAAPALPVSAIPLAASPSTVTEFCERRARHHKFAVMCPTLYPLAKRSRVEGTGESLRGPSFYWASFNDPSGFGSGDEGHLILGGQRSPFSLAGSPGQVWPRPGQPRPVQQLPLPRLITVAKSGGGFYVAQRPARILRRTAINGTDALVLLAPAYPEGGLMGGHVIILWNRQHHGYFVSLHFNGSTARPYTVTERADTALAMAVTSAPTIR